MDEPWDSLNRDFMRPIDPEVNYAHMSGPCAWIKDDNEQPDERDILLCPKDGAGDGKETSSH